MADWLGLSVSSLTTLTYPATMEVVLRKKTKMSQSHEAAMTAVLAPSQPISPDSVSVKGYEFSLDEPTDYKKLFESYKTIGFQASNLGSAVDIINEMIEWRSEEEVVEEPSVESDNIREGRKGRCKIFLGYTSNLVSSGLREMIKFVVKTNQVDVVVSSAGKSYTPTDRRHRGRLYKVSGKYIYGCI